MTARTLEFDEPAAGTVWLQISREPDSTVRLVISLQRGWDIDLLLEPDIATVLAADLEARQEPAQPATTTDGQTATVTVAGDRLAISIPDESLAASLNLAGHATALAEALNVV